VGRSLKRTLRPLRPGQRFTVQQNPLRFLQGLLLMGSVIGLASWMFNEWFNRTVTEAGLRDPLARSDNWQLLVFSVLMLAGSFAIRAYRRRQP
jgi:hypothetical protein